MEPLELELAALGRIPVTLRQWGTLLAGATKKQYAGATPDPAVDTPSLVAARPVSSDNLDPLQEALGKRILTVADLVDHARLQFKNIDDDRAAVIASAGSLLPAP